MSKQDSLNKMKNLLEQGVANKRAKNVLAAVFKESDFFDANDLLQVKYEMLRQVLIDNQPVNEAASAFGFSRVAFYQIKACFEEAGLAGLLPRQRGPKAGHKITPEILEFVKELLTEDKSLRSLDLVNKVEQHFGVSVHTRTIERALERAKKKQ